MAPCIQLCSTMDVDFHRYGNSGETTAQYSRRSIGACLGALERCGLTYWGMLRVSKLVTRPDPAGFAVWGPRRFLSLAARRAWVVFRLELHHGRIGYRHQLSPRTGSLGTSPDSQRALANAAPQAVQRHLRAFDGDRYIYSSACYVRTVAGACRPTLGGSSALFLYRQHCNTSKMGGGHRNGGPTLRNSHSERG